MNQCKSRKNMDTFSKFEPNSFVEGVSTEETREGDVVLKIMGRHPPLFDKTN